MGLFFFLVASVFKESLFGLLQFRGLMNWLDQTMKKIRKKFLSQFLWKRSLFSEGSWILKFVGLFLN